MAVSGELRYFGPAFSSVESVRPVNAITFPASLAMGNITRLRNLEYMAEARASDLGPRTSGASGFRLPAPGSRLESKSPPCPSTGRTDKDGAPAVSAPAGLRP